MTMTQTQRELLFKDICCRLPYGVKAYVRHYSKLDRKWYEGIYTINSAYPHTNEIYVTSETGSVDVLVGYDDYEIKPYLFPIESITIEQKKELSKLGVSYCEYAFHDDTRGLGIMVDEAYIFFEFCYKHHIDFLGLIDMGLAIDCTTLNIY